MTKYAHFLSIKSLVLAFFLLGTLPVAAHALERDTVQVARWLAAGPFETPLPAFHDVKNIRGETFGAKDMLKFDHLDPDSLRPLDGRSVVFPDGSRSTWRVLSGASPTFGRGGEHPQAAYLATYITVGRWAEGTLEITSPHLLQLFVNGERAADKTSNETDSGRDAGSLTHSLKLEPGPHEVVIKSVRSVDNDRPWEISARIVPADGFGAEDFEITTHPERRVTLQHVLEGPVPQNVTLSADGEIAAVTIRKASPPGNDSETWIELRRTSDGNPIRTFRGSGAMGGFQWAPQGRRYSYTTSSDGKSTLWIGDLDGGSTKQLLKDVRHLGGHQWSPDGRFIVYAVSERPKGDDTGVTRLDGMTDRWPTWRHRSFLYRVDVATGSRMRLTAGDFSTALNSISPDGRWLIFTRSIPDLSARPYSGVHFHMLDLQRVVVDSLFSVPWGGSAQWSPEGDRLLLVGGATMFGEAGVNVPEGMIPNDYDTQAYLYDLDSKTVTPITREFDPAVRAARWGKDGSTIYFSTEDRAYGRLYRYDVRSGDFRLLDAEAEVVSQFDVARNADVAAYIGSGVNQPPRAYVMHPADGRNRVLADPNAARFEDVRLGAVEDWTFTAQSGREIDGHVYYPPGFDPSRTYPLIVYYYGGTAPVSRDFGGRYPKEVWAADGYVVYVLQPSGATGYGQEFSSLHVNDWGIIVADEIIDGVTRFLDAHPFVDRERVGAIGASFGGFMTMLLQTRTDLFAAAVSHAGISSIAAYWGTGFWGYLYSTQAAAGSYPWNRPDIYVDQSPLYRADRITTPLLLLHGTSDTNVPPGESYQMYTALRLLGREVELIEVEGQDHHILEYGKRVKWSNTIRAWFDRWLKDEPAWWEHLYGQ